MRWREQAIFAAKLLAGEMPQNIEEAFAAAKVNLFPTSSGDLEHRLLLPRLVESVQAHRGRVLPARRAIRRRSVFAVSLARQEQRRDHVTAAGAARDDGH